MCGDAAEPGRGLRRILTLGWPLTNAKVAAAAAAKTLGVPSAGARRRDPTSLRVAGGPHGWARPSLLFPNPAADVIEETTVSAERPDRGSQN